MNEQKSKTSERVVSIDVLRGLAMFIILSTQIGGAPIFRTFTKLWGENFPDLAYLRFFSYGQGTGVSVASIAQPIFIFVVGLVIPFALKNRLERVGKKKTYIHIFSRAAILFLFGLIAGGKILNLQFDKLYYYNNVLEYISIGYLFCSVLVLNTSTKVQYIVTAIILLLIWAIYLFIPAPGWQGDKFSNEMNIGIYIDKVVLGNHGHPFKGWTAVLNTFGQICNMLICSACTGPRTRTTP
jgi:predicted acyltransferase